MHISICFFINSKQSYVATNLPAIGIVFLKVKQITRIFAHKTESTISMFEQTYILYKNIEFKIQLV